MAHHAESMDIDDESVFDNKENAFQHSNVLPRTPCTEKGYEELDVSELNMKLRYSITPAASPMSKSMSHCLDNRQNNITDESLNNTVINEYENNLTRSLNSTLNKTEVKTSKVLPLQALPTDIVDNNRSSVLRPLNAATANDITITVSNENEMDNLSFASSSSSMAHTPEATTPTKEISKTDGGSPIMRGLKSVLSMFRSSQSPIPPGDEDPKAADHVVSPADVPLPESKPRAVASTPKNENNKERSVSRRNSPHKESIVFNDDLEKELHWNDDSTIVFSSEKIPIHKLFFQDKPCKPAIFTENVQQEDANSTVEYMDVSYSDLSIKDKTLNATVNKNKATELAESDGEFVDCETTFTQNDAHSKTEELDAATANNTQILNVPENLVPTVNMVNESFSLDTTKDIINLIDAANIIAEENLGRQLDFSTTEIVNQLSDLINESEISATNVISVENNDTVILDKGEISKLSDVQTVNKIQPELLQNQVTSPMNSAIDFPATQQVSLENEDLVNASGIVCDTIIGHVAPKEPKICLASLEANPIPAHDVNSIISVEAKTTKTQQETSYNAVGNPSPVEIQLPNYDPNDINVKLVENTKLEFQEKDMPNASTSQNVLFAALNKPISETQHKVATCPPSLLPSDDPLLNTDTVNTNNIPHEAITVVCDPAQSPTQKPDTSSYVITSQVEIIDDIVDKSTTGPTTMKLITEVENTGANILYTLSPKDFPLPGMDDDTPTKTDELVVDAAAENPAVISIEDKTVNVISIAETTLNKTELVSDEVKVADITMHTSLDTPKEEQMEISFFESTNNKLSESAVMDVSMVNADIKELDQPELLQKDTQSLKIVKIIPEISETTSQNIEVITVTDIVKEEQKSASLEIVPDNNIDGLRNTENISDAISVTAMTKYNTANSDSLNADVNPSSSMTTFEANLPNPPLASDNSQEINIVDDNSMAKIANDSNLKLVLEDIKGVVAEVTPSLNEEHTNILSEKEPCEVNEVIENPDVLRNPDTTINLDTSRVLENKQKIDEEIVLSEGDSPFVSMSAEEEFEPEFKKEDFEKIDNPPPISPKIISKGYNFSFDDIDNIDPFATKTKIRMSPPPDASPNTSAVTEHVSKTSKNDKNINRRKSMPERKKPLKGKKHLNSSIDSTENPSLKRATSKNCDFKTSKSISQQEPPQLSQADINNPASAKQDLVMRSDELDATLATEIITQEEPEITTHKEHVRENAALWVDDSKDNKSLRIAKETTIAQNNEREVTEEVVLSASSSEQSTYFSAGASSTELTDSKNVCNMPELDNFNPFATKSKIRQSPPRDFDIDNPFATKSKIQSSPDTSLVVAQKDCSNSTLTIENKEVLKEATSNISICSGSSKTSEGKDDTVQEVHTEDEDTLEGPFLETDDGSDDGVKMPEVPAVHDKVDVVDFDNLNQPDNDEAAEMFIDAEAFEFLMNQNNTEEVAYSGKESLFLKFDPLFARRVTSEGVAAALNDIKRKQITPKKASIQAPPKELELLSFDKPIPGPSELNKPSETQNSMENRAEDMNVTMSKPMMAVTPAVNPVVTPRKSLTPNRSSRLSMTFTSPAMAVIDRLLSLSSNSPSAGLDTTVTHVDRSQSEADQALTQLRELLAEKEINVYNLRCESKELKERLSTLETQMKSLEAESAERLKKVNELTENLAEKTKMNRNMAAVVEEYERTIASLISETEQDKKRFAEERDQLIRERDEQTAHLSSMEVSFNDLHSKYEKSKQVIMGYKTNEDAYKKSIQDFEENLTKMHTNYELLKQHATSKLNHANQELEKINKAHEAEVLKFNAMLKRKELHITSLEESLAQKIKANEELTAICDELINKVG